MPLPIPASPADVSPAWLTAAFQKVGLLDTGSVLSVDAEIIGQDRGFTGVVARLRLEYSPDAGDNLPHSIVVKMPHAERAVPSEYRARRAANQAASLAMLRRGVREIRFYEEIAPAGYIPAPAMIYSNIDRDSLESILVLEDLKASTPGDGLRGCSRGEVEGILIAIAPLHAHWWEHAALAEREWMQRPAVDPVARRQRFVAALPVFLERFGARLADEFRELTLSLGPRIPALLAAIERAPTTLIHADLHLDNVMFTPGSDIARVRIIDWQSVAIGPPMMDLGSLLTGALEPERMASDTEVLLRVYHAALVNGGVVAYPFESLMRDYRLALLQRVVSVVIWLGTVDLDAVAGRERAIVEAAISDGRLMAATGSQHMLTAIPDG